MRSEAMHRGRALHCASVRCEMKVSLMVCCFCPPCPPCATRPSHGAIRARYTTHFVSHRSPPLPDLLAPPARLTRESPQGLESLSPPCSGPKPLSVRAYLQLFSLSLTFYDPLCYCVFLPCQLR